MLTQAEYLGAPVRLTQCQFLDSEPGADAQPWHRDNARAGVTYLIPLGRIRGDMGPTELLPTSHLEDSSPAAAARGTAGSSPSTRTGTAGPTRDPSL